MPASDDFRPPHNIRWLVELVGVEAALRLIEVHGGCRVFVPRKILKKSEIVASTGLQPAVLAPLSRARGGELIKLPLCREWRVRLYRARDGESYSAIARRLGVVESTVWRILNDGGMTAQMELPLS